MNVTWRAAQFALLTLSFAPFGCKTANPPISPAGSAAGTALPRTVIFTGMCDASGAVPLSDRLFAVADDEDNVLRVYDAERGGPPLRAVDLSPGLELPSKKKTPETDLEGATMVGDLAFWITSHGRNSAGKLKPERLRLFATTAKEGAPLQIVGRPYVDLLANLLADPRYLALGLGHAATRAPKEPGGLNIEGLTATPGGGVFIGFRNPVPDGLAIIAPLANPRAVMDGAAAQLGPPIRLSFGGLGVRGLSSWRGRYLVAAGPIAAGESRLYSWSGRSGDAPTLLASFADANPEGFFTPEGLSAILVLSDDGSRLLAGSECKSLPDPAGKSFRGIWIDPEKPRGQPIVAGP